MTTTSATILYGPRETTVVDAVCRGEELRLRLPDLSTATGWKLETQGLCRGEICVPVPPDRRAQWIDDDSGRFDLTAFARHLGQPFVRHDTVWSFGEPARGSGADGGTGPVMAPDFTLPDLDGRMHSLSDHRGKKVFLFSWASW